MWNVSNLGQKDGEVCEELREKMADVIFCIRRNEEDKIL